MGDDIEPGVAKVKGTSDPSATPDTTTPDSDSGVSSPESTTPNSDPTHTTSNPLTPDSSVLNPSGSIFSPVLPASTPEEVARIRRCVKIVGEEILRDIVRELYSNESMNTNGGQMTISEYCTQKNYNPITDQGFNPILNSNLKEKDFDLRSGYEILTKICAEQFQKLSSECREKVRKLCEVVSDVAIGEVTKNDMDLAPAMHSVRQIREIVYSSLASFLEKDLGQLKEETELLEKILLSEDGEFDNETGISDVEVDMYQKLKMTVKGYQALSEHYDKLGDLNPSIWKDRERNKAESEIVPLKMEDIFTEPMIKEGEKVVSLKDLVTENGLLILNGLAGSGKSSLCQYLVHEWLKGGTNVNGLRRFDIVFFIEIQGARSTNLKEYLLDQLLPMYCAGFDTELVIPMLKELNILFLIDGFDQTTRDSCDLVEDILAKFGEKQILLTTRAELHKDAVSMTKRHRVLYRHLQLCGFEEDMHEQLMRKIFKVMMKDKATRQGHRRVLMEYTRERRKSLEPFLRIPLTAMLLVLMWIENPKIYATTTGLYQQMFRQLQKKMCERLSKEIIGVSDLPENLYHLTLYLGEQAWETIVQDSLNLSSLCQRKVELECEAKGVEAVQFLSGYHLCHIHEDPTEWRLRIAFNHGAQARYLAAVYLAKCIRQKILKIQDIGAQMEAYPQFDELLLFLVGRLVIEDSLNPAAVTEIFTVMKKLTIEPTNFAYWWKLFEESKHFPQIGAVIAQEKVQPKHWVLNQTNATHALRLMCFTTVKVKTILLDIPDDQEPFDFPGMLSVLQEVDKHLKKRIKKLIKVEMHLRRHELPNMTHTSDDFLWALGCWGNLINFTGSLGEQPEGEEIMACFPDLKSLHVRVSTAAAFKSLSIGLKKIYKSIRSLEVTLDLKEECPLETFSELRHNGTMELCLVGMKDEQKEWLVEVVKVLGGRGGCWRLRLVTCSLSYDALEWVVKQLRGIVRNKIDIET